MALSLPEKTSTSEKQFLDYTFFLLGSYFRTFTNTASRNIGGRIHGPSPYLKFWGTFYSPFLPKSPPMHAHTHTQFELIKEEIVR